MWEKKGAETKKLVQPIRNRKWVSIISKRKFEGAYKLWRVLLCKWQSSLYQSNSPEMIIIHPGKIQDTSRRHRAAAARQELTRGRPSKARSAVGGGGGICGFSPENTRLGVARAAAARLESRSLPGLKGQTLGNEG